MRVVLWGTYDTGKPRTRILLAALREASVEVLEIHCEVWSGVEDKSQVFELRSRIRLFLTCLASYPRLVLRYIRAPNHDAVIVGYLGHLDVLVLWPFALLKGKPIVWDAYLSLYDTVVLDRKLVGRNTPIAWLLWVWEWLACRASRRVVLDTAAHAQLFRELYDLHTGRMATALVGAEADFFSRDTKLQEKAPSDKSDIVTILFFGQFIPLHGIDTIIRAAQIAHDGPYRWLLIGQGQEEARIRTLIKEGPKIDLEWIPWVPYATLNKWICQSDVCLGIFGDTGKASRVIPNKVFQALAAGRPLITRDSSAVRELISDPSPGIYLVPPADPEALLNALERYLRERAALMEADKHLHSTTCERFSLPSLGASWLSILHGAIGTRPVPQLLRK